MLLGCPQGHWTHSRCCRVQGLKPCVAEKRGFHLQDPGGSTCCVQQHTYTKPTHPSPYLALPSRSALPAPPGGPRPTCVDMPIKAANHTSVSQAGALLRQSRHASTPEHNSRLSPIMAASTEEQPQDGPHTCMAVQVQV